VSARPAASVQIKVRKPGPDRQEFKSLIIAQMPFHYHVNGTRKDPENPGKSRRLSPRS